MLKFLLALCFFSTLAQAQILVDTPTLKRKTFVELMPQNVINAYEANIKELKSLGFPKKAMKVGSKVPDFRINLAGKIYPISSVYAAGSVVLKFYPGKKCESCLNDLRKYNEKNGDFKNAGAQIIAISTDSDEVNAKVKEEHFIKFDILSDVELEKAFMLKHKADSPFVKNMKAKGLDLTKYQDDKKSEVSLPATYLINKDGKIAFSYIGIDVNKPVDPNIVLDATKKMQEVLK